MNRRERRIAAKSSTAAPVAGSAASPDALNQAGVAHFQAGRRLDAQVCCQQALALDADHAATLHLMGLLSLQATQFDHAREWIARAIRRDARPEYLASLGAVLQQQGLYEEALQVVDKAVQLAPDNADLWKQLGDILLQQKRLNEALLTYQHVLKLNPQHQDAHCKSGALLAQFERYQDAITHLDASCELLPNHAPTLQVRSRTLFHLKRFEEALSAGRQTHALDSLDANTCNFTGLAAMQLNRHAEALQWFDRALEIRPDYVAALENRLLALVQLHRFEEVFAHYERMKALGLNGPSNEMNVGLAYLLMGNFEEGSPRYQARLDLPSATYPKLSRPMWLGEESIEGKTILAAADEGIGDTIQFVRYVPMLAERGARVVLLVQTSLHPLLSGINGVSLCIPPSEADRPPPFDFHCPLPSLPLAFGTRLDTIPSAKSYLPLPDKSRRDVWEDRLGPRSKPRVGLVWSGSLIHPNDHNRSIPFKTFSRILDADASFVSLQKDPRPGDVAPLAERTDIVDLTSHLTDFVETAALVSCLDLVITVDTSVAHLSGALGKPVWILLPYTPDHRWLLGRDDSPWYPSMRLFRQDETRDYAKVLDRVRTELQALIPQLDKRQ
jgi:tetratricopeptide (TPR) repeat protein